MKNLNIIVETYDHNTPLSDVHILMIFPNNTPATAKSDQFGEAELYLYTLDEPMTIYAAKEGYHAYLQENWNPTTESLKIQMDKLDKGGSIIFENGTGYIPNLDGRLNPISDTLDRTYLYTSNTISINGGKAKPVTFSIGENMHLQDKWNNEYNIRIISIRNEMSLIEYSPPD